MTDIDPADWGNHPLVGRRLPAETATGKHVRIEVTAVTSTGPAGYAVYGYRLGGIGQRAQAIPREYFVPARRPA